MGCISLEWTVLAYLFSIFVFYCIVHMYNHMNNAELSLSKRILLLACILAIGLLLVVMMYSLIAFSLTGNALC